MSAQQTLVPALDVSECYICNEPFDTWTGSGAIESRFVLGCGHTFASACVQRWVNENSSCPMVLTSLFKVFLRVLLNRMI